MVHPDDNMDRMRATAERFGYQYSYSNEKIAYLVAMICLWNGFVRSWPKMPDGKPASIIYDRPLITKPFRSGIGVGGRHLSTLSLIEYPMGLYFDEKTAQNGVNVYFHFTTFNNSVASDGQVHKLNARYENASILREMAQSLPGHTAETIEIVNGHLKEGSSDTVALLCKNRIICPSSSGNRLPGTTMLFVEKIAPTLGLAVEYGDVSVADIFKCEGLVLLGNAVNILGVDKAYFKAENLAGMDAGEPVEKLKVRMMGETRESDVVAYQFKTTQMPAFSVLAKALSDAWTTDRFGKYSICLNDVIVPGAVVAMERAGQRMKEKLSPYDDGRPKKYSMLEVRLPNILRSGASITLPSRIWPKPGVRKVDLRWSNGLRRQSRLNI